MRFVSCQFYFAFENIGTSDEVKAKKEEIATARIVSMENNEIKELKLMMLAMEKKLDEQSKKINQLEQKLDYLTQGSSTDNVKLMNRNILRYLYFSILEYYYYR